MKFRLLLVALFTSLLAFPALAEIQYLDPVESSTAPGMNSCTSTKGCKVCTQKDGDRYLSCATLYYEDGYCNCNDDNSCQLSGACKYVG